MFPERLSCRQVLNIMVILGFMLNYMLRVNLTIAIVAMVVPDKTSHSSNMNLGNEPQCSGSITGSSNVTSDMSEIMQIRGSLGYVSGLGNINTTNGSNLPDFPPHQVCLKNQILYSLGALKIIPITCHPYWWSQK